MADDLAGLLVGTRERNSNSPTFTSTPTLIMSVRAPVTSLRLYHVLVSGEVEMTSTESGVVTQHEIRITYDNTEPTVSSFHAGRTVLPQQPDGLPTGVIISALVPGVDGYLRAAVVSHRPIGSATCQWTAGTNPSRQMRIMVFDAGPIIPEDGTIYT